MKIKICHIVNVITGRTDGVFKHMTYLFKYLDKTKYEQYLIYQGGEDVKFQCEQIGLKYFEIPELNKTFSIKALKRIKNIINEHNIDIIHSHVVKPYIYAGILNFFLNKKHMFNYHGIFLRNNYYYSSVHKTIIGLLHSVINLFSKVDLVVVPSKSSKKILSSESRLFKNIEYYYDPIEINYNQEINKPFDKNEQFIIGMISRLEYQKRIDKAIEIMRILVDMNLNTKLIIYGDGTLEDQLKNSIKKKNLEDRIEIKGFIQNVSEVLKTFDLILYTSDFEGLPISLLEAISFGIPVVASNVGGHKEIVEEFNCGFVYDKDDLIKAANYIIKIIEDESLREEFRMNAKNAADNYFTVQNFITKFESFYNDLMINSNDKDSAYLS